MPETSVRPQPGSSKPPTPPTPLSRRWVRYVVGYGVGVGVGLAPYLGKVRVPGFVALLTLIPDSHHAVALPISAFLMGAVAVWIQWHAGERPSKARLRRQFRTWFAATMVGIGAFFAVQQFVVVPVEVPADGTTTSFLVGFNRPVRPPCTAEVSDARCIQFLTLNPAQVSGFWGDRQVRLAGLLLIATYLLATGSLGAIIGLVILREEKG